MRLEQLRWRSLDKLAGGLAILVFLDVSALGVGVSRVMPASSSALLLAALPCV